jgi:hypothetical protein
MPRRWLDLVEVEVETMAGHQDGTWLEIRPNRRLVDIPLKFIRQQNVDHISLLDGIFNRQRLKAMAFGEVIIGTTRSLGDNDIEPAVSQVLSLGMALAAISNDGNRFAGKNGEVGVSFVVDGGGHEGLLLNQLRKGKSVVLLFFA